MTFSVTYIYPKKNNLQAVLWHFVSHTILEKIASDSLYTSPPTRNLGGGGSLFSISSALHFTHPQHSRRETENRKRETKKGNGMNWLFVLFFVFSFVFFCLWLLNTYKKHKESTRRAEETQRGGNTERGIDTISV